MPLLWRPSGPWDDLGIMGGARKDVRLEVQAWISIASIGLLRVFLSTTKKGLVFVLLKDVSSDDFGPESGCQGLES